MRIRTLTRAITATALHVAAPALAAGSLRAVGMRPLEWSPKGGRNGT